MYNNSSKKYIVFVSFQTVTARKLQENAIITYVQQIASIVVQQLF